jgi:hypothetical protein
MIKHTGVACLRECPDNASPVCKNRFAVWKHFWTESPVGGGSIDPIHLELFSQFFYAGGGGGAVDLGCNLQPFDFHEGMDQGDAREFLVKIQGVYFTFKGPLLQVLRRTVCLNVKCPRHLTRFKVDAANNSLQLYFPPGPVPRATRGRRSVRSVDALIEHYFAINITDDS